MIYQKFNDKSIQEVIGPDRKRNSKVNLNRVIISNSMYVSEDDKPYGKENIRENYNYIQKNNELYTFFQSPNDDSKL